MYDSFLIPITDTLKKKSTTFSLMLFILILSNSSLILAQNVSVMPLTLGICNYEHISNAQGISNIAMGCSMLNQEYTGSYPSFICSAYSCSESVISELTATPDPIPTVWNLSLHEAPQTALSSIVSLQEQTLSKQSNPLAEFLLNTQANSLIIKDAISVQSEVPIDLWSSYARAVLTRQNPDPQALTYDIVSSHIFKQLFGSNSIILNNLLNQFGNGQDSNILNGVVRHRIINSKQNIQNAQEFTTDASGSQSASLFITPLSRNLINK